MGISGYTPIMHERTVYGKLGVRSRSELVVRLRPA